MRLVQLLWLLVGYTGEESLDEVRACVGDVTLETESEAVSAVAVLP